MMDRVIHIFLAISCIALAISLLDRPRALPPVHVSDNGIISPDLLRMIAEENLILDRQVQDLRLDDSQLDRAVEAVSAAGKVKIDVNWKAIEDCGIDRTIPVHVSLHHGTLRQVLTGLIDHVGGSNTRFRFTVNHGTIFLTTADDLSKNLSTEIYNIRPIVEEIKRANPPMAHVPGVTFDQAVESICKTISDMVAADSWGNVVGEVGNISEVGGLLVVTQTRENHRTIATLLTRLYAEMKK